MKTDRAVSLGLAIAGTAGLALGYSNPAVLATYLLLLNGVALWRWHDRNDWIGWTLGATLGNLTELSSDAAGLWVHATRGVFGIAPVYILLCYPLLWLVVPRLLHGVAKASVRTSRRDASVALALWALHCSLSCAARDSKSLLTVISIALVATLLRLFPSRTDFVYAGLGASLGLLWEIPCTMTGAWTFPATDVAHLIPAWLPFAYATFFVSLNRVRMFACQPVTTSPYDCGDNTKPPRQHLPKPLEPPASCTPTSPAASL